MARSSFSRSKGSRRPAFLITVSSRNCTRSKVVKRPPQPGHRRRRRIAALSSDGLLSFTWVSSCPQNGQRMEVPFFDLRIDRKAVAEIEHAVSDAGFNGGIAPFALGGNTIQNFGDHLSDLAELRRAETARGAGGRTPAENRGKPRALLIAPANVVLSRP